jgi:hypothetical protein
MNCNRANELLIESLAAPLAGGDAAELAAHLAACDGCRVEAAALRRMWEELERLPEEIPGEEMRQRFAANLEPWLEAGESDRRGRRSGLAGGARRALDRLGGGLESWLERWLPRRPLAQAGLAAATLALGVLIGSGHGTGLWPGSGRAAGPAAQIGELRDEVRSLSRLVTLSLLKQDSASERLRGVSFGRQAGGADDRVLQALLDTLRHDPDVNVRLAAVDALAPALGRPAVRDQMLQEVARQASPMVQIALIDLLLGRDRAGSERRLVELAASPSLDGTVRGYLRSRLRRVS